jgi:beta-lactamase regulating signal transducer with metallopeptidase domain
MSDIALRFLFANAAAAIAILLVIALRKPARSAFGARLAYGLWLLVPLAALGSLLPPRVLEVARPAPPVTASYPPPSSAPDLLPAAPTPVLVDAPALPSALSPGPSVREPWSPDPWMLGFVAWLAGALGMALWQLRGQLRFLADARAGFAGPAVAGFLRPRIITPSDFESRFDNDERQVILAHETIHLRRNDARINAVVALLRCLCWFNPLVHIAAHLMRIDQELACDATVVERQPRARAVYATALLKAQLAARPLPLGCYWPAGTEHPLTERVEMLKQARPTPARRAAGASALALLALGACACAWAAVPAEERVVQEIEGQLPPKDYSALPAFDDADRVDVTGTIVRIGPKSDFWLQATSVRRNGGPATPDTQLWRINMDALWAGLDRIAAGEESGYAPADPSMQVGPVITVSAYNAKNKSCQPCMAQAYMITRPPAATGGDSTTPAPQPAPTNAPVPDQGDLIYLRGKVEKIEFGETTYTVFVRAENMAADPYSLAQPDTRLWALNPTNYFGDTDNRNRILTSLADRRIDVFGERVSDTSCTPACLMEAREIFLQPANTGFEGGFAGLPGHIVLDAVIDTSAPIQLKGTVVRFDNAEESATPHGVLWVEAESVGPTGTPGATPGTMWRVAGFPAHVLQSRFWQGAEVTVNGFNVRDKSCEPACVMIGKQIQNGFSNLSAAN